jgi:hypothetical protein
MRASTLPRWMALWALGFVRASVQARNGGCGRGSSLTYIAVKYAGKQHADNLKNALLKTYELTTDWTATVYSGMTLKWDYKNRTCDISMHVYVSNVLIKFIKDSPKQTQHTPYRYVTPVYGNKAQYAMKDETPPLTAQQCLTIQKVTNQLLDYLATHPDATIIYHASDMILHIHSDASYLSVSNARSCLGGLFFLGNTPRTR